MADPISIAAQLSDARQQKDMKLEELRQAARLTCSADSLCRKLSGKQKLTTREAEELARALDYQIVWPPRSQAA